MPGSRVNSIVSNGSNKSKYSMRYRTKSSKSQVDETLFASKKPAAKAPSEPPSPIERHKDQMKRLKKKKPETIELITKDLIRTCRIPRHEDPSGLTVVLPRGKFSQLKESCKVKTREQAQQEQENISKKKLTDMEESQRRKDEMKDRELNRRKMEKLSVLEEEAKNKSEYLQRKADEAKLEDDDQVKQINTMIANAKVHAIRDAQVMEKALIGKEMKEEEMRLDTMMEIDRINAIRAAEDIDELKQKQRFLNAKLLLNQIKGNTEEKILNEERKDQETKIVLQKLQELHQLDEKEIAEKKVRKDNLRKELDYYSQQQQKHRERTVRQEKQAAFKAMEYQKQKDERDIALEEEKKMIKKKKEKEVAEMLLLQERAIDSQAEKDALRARRNMEQTEREWRRKEALEAEKKMKENEMMRRARQEQIEDKRHFMAVQAQSERAAFEKVLKEQKRSMEKDLEREQILQQGRRKNNEVIRMQMRRKEEDLIEERRKMFEEGVRLEEEARKRNIRINEVKNKKLVELREAGIPMKYCSVIDNKVNKYMFRVFTVKNKYISCIYCEK